MFNLCKLCVIIALCIVCAGVMVILFRVFWDPIYCCIVSTANPKVIYSSEKLIQLSKSVYISEHVVNSGQSSCWSRNSTKYSRMLIVCDVQTHTIALFNPCPLIKQLQQELARLGTITHVVITNCFHYMNTLAYIHTYPNATFIAPAGLFHKQPKLTKHCTVFPSATHGSLFKNTQYFRLPEFHQEHVIYVKEANLIFCSDTLICRDKTKRDPGRTWMSFIPLFARMVSIRRCVSPVRFCDYSRQFRVGTTFKFVENTCIWKTVLSLPITKITSGHGVFNGYVSVTPKDLQILLRDIASADSWVDRIGRGIFILCILHARVWFYDWVCLYDKDAQPSCYYKKHITSSAPQ